MDDVPFGIALGAAVAVIAYTAIRILERSLFLEPNPAALIWSDQSPFVWRAAMAAYLGGAAVFGGSALAARAPRSAGRLLFGVTIASLLAIFVQAAWWP